MRPIMVCSMVMLVAACGGAGEQTPDDSAGLTSNPAPASPVPDSPGSTPVDTPRAGTGAAAPDTLPSSPAVPPSAPIAGPDTASGIVNLLGAGIDARIVVQTSTGPLAIVGDLATTIGRLQGARVWIQGPLSVAIGRAIPPRQITAERFEVREVGGEPALDGTLRQEGDAWMIVGPRGTSSRLTAPPAGLRELTGRRVWVTRGQDGSVASFGEIR